MNLILILEETSTIWYRYFVWHQWFQKLCLLRFESFHNPGWPLWFELFWVHSRLFPPCSQKLRTFNVWLVEWCVTRLSLSWAADANAKCKSLRHHLTDNSCYFIIAKFSGFHPRLKKITVWRVEKNPIRIRNKTVQLVLMCKQNTVTINRSKLTRLTCHCWRLLLF